MSTDKSVTTATIKFYPNKHIEVKLDDLKNVHPRALSIAGNLLTRKYLEMRAQFNAKEHQKARKAKKKAAEDAVEANAAFHIAEDERLAAAGEANAPPVESAELGPAPAKVVEPKEKLPEVEVLADEDETDDLTDSK